MTLCGSFHETGKVVSAVCHGPAALANLKSSNRTYLIARLNVIGISDVGEDILRFSRDMSFLLETELHEYGGIYEKADGLFGVKVLTSGENGKSVTGQNTSNATLVGDNIIRAAGMYFADATEQFLFYYLDLFSDSYSRQMGFHDRTPVS
ncbi:hypothetical protein AnigIFM49718_006678 [Aspergillus niger]|nr:hypothetical protein AnigIFM49718_006678 [Aspergillus niger]